MCLGLLLLASQESVDRSGKFLATLEEIEFEHEDEAHEVTSHLLDELTTGLSRATY